MPIPECRRKELPVPSAAQFAEDDRGRDGGISGLRPLSSFDPGSPARSSPCFSSSRVRTPKPTGLPVWMLTCVRPLVAASETYSKCGVPPRMMTPSATTASAPASRAALATTGSSKLPGTRTRRWLAPLASRALTAPAMRPSVMVSCQVPAMTTMSRPVPSTLMVGILRRSCGLLSSSPECVEGVGGARSSRESRAAVDYWWGCGSGASSNPMLWPMRSRLVSR